MTTNLVTSTSCVICGTSYAPLTRVCGHYSDEQRVCNKCSPIVHETIRLMTVCQVTHYSAYYKLSAIEDRFHEENSR